MAIISLGTHSPTHPPTRPSQTVRYSSLEQSKLAMAPPRKHGWTKNVGTPVIGWCYRLDLSEITYLDGDPPYGALAAESMLELVWYQTPEDGIDIKRRFIDWQIV